jgi:hypothetical protein
VGRHLLGPGAGPLARGQRCIASVPHGNRDRYAYLRDVHERLPARPASNIAELSPHRYPANRH